MGERTNADRRELMLSIVRIQQAAAQAEGKQFGYEEHEEGFILFIDGKRDSTITYEELALVEQMAEHQIDHGQQVDFGPIWQAITQR